MTDYRAETPEATHALGVVIGRSLEPGDVLGLVGTLGAGKTLLMHGIVEGVLGGEPHGLGIHVCSPSYTMVNTYTSGDHIIHHLDLYRLDGGDDLESIGYWDVVEEPGAIVVVEWIDQVEGALPDGAVALQVMVEDREDPDASPRAFHVLEGANGRLGRRLCEALAALESS